MPVEGVRLPFPEAIDFFRRKVNLPTARWDDLRHGAHVRAFSVAGVTQADMLADFRGAMDRAQSTGTGYGDFKKAFNEIVDRTGWQFNAVGESEEDRRDWRARVIFNTNSRVAYMAGRYAQLMDPDVLKYRPFWRYRHNDVRHPRPQHLEWDGLILLATNPWWKIHFPPNGFGCQCDVVALNRRQVQAMGKDGPDPTPADDSFLGRDPRTGEPETRWPGVDRGWEYNPGEEAMSGAVPVELQTPLAPPRESAGTPAEAEAPRPELPPLPRPTPVPASRLLPAGQPDEAYVSAFLEEFGASLDQGAVFRDASGGTIVVDKSMFEQRTVDGEVVGFKSSKRGRGEHALLLADAVREPDEIWVDWVKVASGFVLRRAYLRQVTMPDGKSLLTRFEWSRRGWFGVTAFDTTKNYLEKLRKGALLFRRKT